MSTPYYGHPGGHPINLPGPTEYPLRSQKRKPFRSNRFFFRTPEEESFSVIYYRELENGTSKGDSRGYKVSTSGNEGGLEPQESK